LGTRTCPTRRAQNVAATWARSCAPLRLSSYGAGQSQLDCQ
jgi:hypothetical protein